MDTSILSSIDPLGCFYYRISQGPFDIKTAQGKISHWKQEPLKATVDSAVEMVQTLVSWIDIPYQTGFG